MGFYDEPVAPKITKIKWITTGKEEEKKHTPYFMNLRDSNDAYQGVDCIYKAQR